MRLRVIITMAEVKEDIINERKYRFKIKRSWANPCYGTYFGTLYYMPNARRYYCVEKCLCFSVDKRLSLPEQKKSAFEKLRALIKENQYATKKLKKRKLNLIENQDESAAAPAKL